MDELTASIGSIVFEAPDFEHLEERVLTALCRDGCALTSAALARLDDTLESPEGWKVKDIRPRVVVTRFGPVRISRRRYTDQHGRGRYLLDEHLGLPARSRVSPAVERKLVPLSASVSFREAAGIVSDLTGAHVSHGTAHALVRRAGMRLAAEQRAHASDLHDLGLDPGGKRVADPLLAEADGTVVAWQGERARRGEVRLAVFRGGRASGPSIAYASVEDARSFWRAASALCGRSFDLVSARGTVLSGDGANWIRGGLDVLPNSRFLLDPFHVQLALRVAVGSHPVARKLSSLLYSHGLEELSRVLALFAKQHPERDLDVARVLSYLRANSDGLWRSDPSLGSIEGHIDKCLANRFKKRGMRWSKRGADAMARVVAAKRSERPLPIGAWIEPRPARGARPKAPILMPPSSEPTPARVPQGGIVSHARGAGFTKTLRDIARGGRAD